MVAGRETKTEVALWGRQLGAAVWNDAEHLAHFHYTPEFLRSSLDVAPITMPLHPKRFAFPELNAHVFKGLPGFLADSLPDKFGTKVIDTWLAVQGRDPGSLNPVERLRLIGDKGMGALEYQPALQQAPEVSYRTLDLPALVDAINIILSEDFVVEPFREPPLRDALEILMSTSVSADGSRAKAAVLFNPETEELVAGQEAPPGFEYWLLKFDGISGNRDREAADPQGWGLVEYAYHLMARRAGIHMEDCRLLNDNGRYHFLTRRFDRTPTGEKIHRQSLCAMGHMDFDAVGTHSYEEVLHIIRDLGMGPEALEQQFRRMVFNVLARNHDDHAKNIAFLMDPNGEWSLSPAYDLTFAYNPEGHWTQQHQMKLNGKRDHFARVDLHAVARHAEITVSRADEIIQQVADAVVEWPLFADRAGVPAEQIEAIAADLRLDLT